MHRIFGLILAVFILSYSCCAEAIVFEEMAAVKGEVVEAYNPPVPDESVLIEELRKNVYLKIKILEVIAPKEKKNTYNISGDKEKGNIVPVHEVISREPLAKNEVFEGDLTYVILEHHKYGYVTKEVKLEVRKIFPVKENQKQEEQR